MIQHVHTCRSSSSSTLIIDITVLAEYDLDYVRTAGYYADRGGSLEYRVQPYGGQGRPRNLFLSIRA